MLPKHDNVLDREVLRFGDSAEPLLDSDGEEGRGEAERKAEEPKQVELDVEWIGGERRRWRKRFDRRVYEALGDNEGRQLGGYASKRLCCRLARVLLQILVGVDGERCDHRREQTGL